ncbi:alcohol dehydrogenase catalytic domain-containing protein [Streptomyces sp. NPDC020996]|uniref:alcohol dehydrogenase catalytic domain-containing protein n=1 Tax=Streptomyces sp. NPDC020996 TaxID=3154791 RepID=UPI0033DA5023
MQQLTFAGTRKPEWCDVPAPVLRSGIEALVRRMASSTCDLDHLILSGATPFRPPFPLGHECVAEVLDVGDDVRRVTPGQLVVIPWHINCGTCAECRSGRPALCRSTPPAASYGIPDDRPGIHRRTPVREQGSENAGFPIGITNAVNPFSCAIASTRPAEGRRADPATT